MADEAQPQDVKKTNKKPPTAIGCGALLVLVIIIAITIGVCLGGESDDTSQPPFMEQVVTESSVRTALQKLSGTDVVPADCITKIEFPVGTNNPYGCIIHVYFQPDAVWDDEDAVEKAVHTSIKAMEILFGNDNVAEVVMWEMLEFTDKYGETTVETAVRIMMKKEVADKIVDWGKVDDRAWGDYNTFFDLAELQYIHPAILKNL